jgi:hypothetical protein
MEQEQDTITKLYENVGYFDQYGGTVIVFICITLCTLLLFSYFQMMLNIQPIINDWTNQRCKPSIIPFAGLITHPEGVSAGEYTAQNFNYCMQNILSNISGILLEPITFVTHSLTSNANNVQNSIQGVRSMFDNIRTSMQSVSEEIMGRIMNVVIPIIQMIIKFKDVSSKLQGILTASLYTSLGAYYSFRSLIGAIAQFIVIILIILAALIAGLWMVPFTWGAAAANTVIFTAIAIPMAIILSFMKDTLHINSGLSIPSVKCFDKNTQIQMNDGTFKTITSIQPGDVLMNDNKVTAKIKVATEGSTMYMLHGIIVSDSHMVKIKYNSNNNTNKNKISIPQEKWIRVCEHPDAVHVRDYGEPFLYCLNTSTKMIVIKDQVFSDWDELNEEQIDHLLYILKSPNRPEQIHTFLDYGFDGKTKIELDNGEYVRIKNIEIGSFLKNGEMVYGIVQIDGSNLVKQHQETCLFHLLTNTGTFELEENNVIHDYNWIIDFFFLREINNNK